MASKRQIKANQANAAKSSGPKTITGKARSSRNAYRHGLSRWNDDARHGQEALGITPAAMWGEASRADATEDLARAQLRLADIRKVRFEMLLALMDRAGPNQMKQVASLERYEKAARVRQRRGLERLKITSEN